jgi:hypothetical protein
MPESVVALADVSFALLLGLIVTLLAFLGLKPLYETFSTHQRTRAPGLWHRQLFAVWLVYLLGAFLGVSVGSTVLLAFTPLETPVMTYYLPAVVALTFTTLLRFLCITGDPKTSVLLIVAFQAALCAVVAVGWLEQTGLLDNEIQYRLVVLFPDLADRKKAGVAIALVATGFYGFGEFALRMWLIGVRRQWWS